MGKKFTSLDDAIKEANKRSIAEMVLLDDVAPVVEDILRKHIERDIYGKYSPTQYERRNSLTQNIVSKMLSDNEMLVTAIAQPNKPAHGWVSSGDGAFLYMLEKGNLGWWRKEFPRPAISNAQNEVDHSSKVKQAKKNGLKRVLGG